MLKVINPATEELIANIREDNENDVREAFYLAKTKQISWADTPYQERKKLITNFKDLLDKNKLNIATELTLQMGKPLKAALYEIEASCDRINWFLNETEKHLRPQTIYQEKNLVEKITNSYILNNVYHSDHCPVVLELN